MKLIWSYFFFIDTFTMKMVSRREQHAFLGMDGHSVELHYKACDRRAFKLSQSHPHTKIVQKLGLSQPKVISQEKSPTKSCLR